ncbi:MAG: AAC(3) family N-acetyltransferase [Oscillospiraceae bacterium]
MSTAITGTDLANGLEELGVRPGMALEVHCSLSSFGHVEGGAETVIDTLMRRVGEGGAVVMPSFRLSPNLPLTEEDERMGLTAKIRILPEDETRSAMGIVADTFRQRPDVVTGNGIFRVSAWGRDAGKNGSGLQNLIDTGGCALLLGVDIYRLSAMHYVEDAMPAEISDRFAPSAEARAKYPEDQWMIEAWSPEVKPWYAIQEEAYAKGLITDGYIGDAKCMFFEVRPVIELYRKALLERPFELYGLR